MSDHLSLLLVPAYTPLKKKSRPVTKNIQIWPEGALSQLQDYFVRTAWSIFEHFYVQEHTESVLHKEVHQQCYSGEAHPDLPQSKPMDDHGCLDTP